MVTAKDPELPVKRNETLNVCHGTIIIPNEIETGDALFTECGEKIKDNMEIQGFNIKNVETYIRPPRGIRKYPLRIAKVTFDGRILPNTVVIGGQRLSVREYVPTPRQCSKCWKYGHSMKYCNSKFAVCPICGLKDHQKEHCSENRKYCINCEGSHPAFSKACLYFKREQLIVKTLFKEGLSYKAAVNKLKQQGELTSYNYRKVLQHNMPTTSTPTSRQFKTANRFSALEVDDIQNPLNNQFSVLQVDEDSQSHAISQDPTKKMFKRNRNNSSEEEVSPKLNPKQKQKKTGNQSSEIKVHEVVA